MSTTATQPVLDPLACLRHVSGLFACREITECLHEFGEPGRVLLNPPRLKIDDILHPNARPSPRGVLERRIVWALLRHLEARGFMPVKVLEDEAHRTTTALEVMEWVFNLDDARVRFRKGEGKECEVYIVLGNDGDDCISDWSWPKDDAESAVAFQRAMDSFNPEDHV